MKDYYIRSMGNILQTTTYRTQHAPPTPPPQRDEEGIFWVIVENCEEVDFATYYSDTDSEDEFTEIKKDTVLSDKHTQVRLDSYSSEDIYM